MNLKTTLWLCLMLLTTNLMAQAPDIINYQAIVRDANNTVITNQNVSVKFIITETSATGNVAYEEIHSPTTNSHGLINLKIGTGTLVNGTLAGIDWSSNSYFLTTSIDPNGASNYTLSGTSELVSVPYALHAKTVDDKDDADADPTNEIELPTGGVDGQVLKTDGTGNYSWIDQSTDTDTDTQLTEVQVDAFVANNGYLTAELDADPTNEIELPTGGTNNQVLKTDGSGNYAWVNQTVDTDTDTQLTETQVDAFVANNGYLTAELDADPNNEIELPTGGTNNQVLKTDGAGNYAWVNQTVDTDTDTQLNEAAVDAMVANNGYLTAEVDGSITNEIQTLSISGTTLSISGTGGNSVTLPTSGASTSYSIGQQLDGGTIIFVDSSGLHGLIVANADLAVTYAYQSGGYTQVSGATSYYDGSANTMALAAAGGTYPAAEACVAHGDGNWYLPSFTECLVIYQNLHLLDGFNFTSGNYWTSTTTSVFGGVTGAVFYLTGAHSFSYDVANTASVRPIRQF